jgi:hypothetical protein
VSNTALEIPRAMMRRVDGEKFILGTELVRLCAKPTNPRLITWEAVLITAGSGSAGVVKMT